MKNINFKKGDLIKFFVIIIICVFSIEFVLMSILEEILDTTHFWESFMDSLFLSIFLSPILYLFFFKYFRREIDNRVGFEEKFRYLFDNSKDAIMTLNPPDWKFTEGNKATLEIYGLRNEEELRKISPSDVSPEFQPDGRLSSEKAKEMINTALDNGYNSFVWTHKKLNGAEFLANVSLTKIELDNEIFLQAVVRDITEEKLASENIKKSEQKLAKALENSERMNKLMVGRELEMINLKKQIIDLKSNKE